MLRKPLLSLPAHPGAVALVGVTAVAGATGCMIGAWAWGFLGIALGLASAWLLFLLGLVAVYVRERAKAPDIAPADCEVPLAGPAGAIPSTGLTAE